MTRKIDQSQAKLNRVAFGIASAITLMTAGTISPAVAQDTQTKEINVEAQALGYAINQIANQSGMQIVLYSEDAKGVSAPALEGTYTVEQALDAILVNTGLGYRRINERTLAVGSPNRLEAQSSAADIEEAFEEDNPSIQDVIVVRALKREQDLQDVPASLSVFGSEDLDAFQIDSIRDLSRLTPNFLGSSFTNTQPIFAIRGGANTLSAIGTSEPVGVYVDEVYLPRFSGADFELFDLESLEVLRGPQGTFFGRNVASGAIILTTAKPSLDDSSIKLQTSYGNFNAYELRGLASGPMSDMVAGKVSVSRVERDGFGQDELTGREQDDLESTALRGALLWQPNDNFEALLSGDYTSDNNRGRTLAAIGFGSDDRRVSTLGVPQSFDREIYGGSLRITHDAGHGEFISITGYRESSSEELFSFNGLNFSRLRFAFQQVDRDFEDPRTFSQEMRYVSNDNRPVSYIAGVFYLNEDSDRRVERNRLLNGAGVVIQDVVFDQNIKTNAYAAYIDGTYGLTDKLDLSAGVRYTFENREAALDFIDNNTTANSFLADGLEEGFDAFTPRVALTYRPNEDVTIYASVSRGFTAGGFNTEADSLGEITTPFDEETILSYESGLKTRFADGKAHANIAYFYQKYEDKQEFVFDTATFVGTILNAADATIQGVEVELDYQFNEYGGIHANYGYLDTEFDSFPLGQGNLEGNTGNELGNSPNNQFAITARGEYPIMDGAADLFMNTSYSWTDDYYTGASNDPDLSVESYGLLGAKIGVRSADARWTAEIFGNNLTDEEFVLIPSDFIVQAEHLGASRTYGIRVTLLY